MSTDKSAAAARELVERWMGEKHPITMQSYVSDLTALIGEHYVAKEEVDKMVSERLREELIKYVKWYGSFPYENMTDEMLVDEYLKSREK
jgi:hypothetical protein